MFPPIKALLIFIMQGVKGIWARGTTLEGGFAELWPLPTSEPSLRVALHGESFEEMYHFNKNVGFSQHVLLLMLAHALRIRYLLTALACSWHITDPTTLHLS